MSLTITLRKTLLTGVYKYVSVRFHRKEFSMFELKMADYVGDYFGFHLKKGYLYGRETTTGCYVASSGWRQNDEISMYYQIDGKWVMKWVNTKKHPEILAVKSDPTQETITKMIIWSVMGNGIPWDEWSDKYPINETKEILKN